ncbi:MAG: YggS family pyridoxal phosphate-dependent enzyme [Desulfuromonadales bacterium]|jgi:pyridoxal phosphate enzyme (YggS family)|nr:YggS family pyridoxal phosphate-dependent enzyme [Desulfuromonadales bacterium]
MDIAANIVQIQERIAAVCNGCGRNPAEVRLVAVSKKKPAADIEAACAAGQTLFGESYVQECVAKIDAVKAAVEWHFIGALQSNKVKYLRGKVAMIHSVDRLSLAEEIDRQWGKDDACVDILIQVNLGEEASKSGTTASDLSDLVRQVARLQHVRIKGLMALPPWDADLDEVRPYFRQLRQLAEQINSLELPNVAMQELSMGMSHDYAVAIEEGATLIRIGTAIFGAR